MKFIIIFLLFFVSIAHSADFTITIQGSSEKKWTLKNGSAKVAVLSLTPTPNTSEYRHISSKAFMNINPSSKTFNGWNQIFFESNNCTGTPYSGFNATPMVIGNNGTLYIPIDVTNVTSVEAHSRRNWYSMDCDVDNFGEVTGSFALKLCGSDCNFTTTTIFSIIEE